MYFFLKAIHLGTCLCLPFSLYIFPFSYLTKEKTPPGHLPFLLCFALAILKISWLPSSTFINQDTKSNTSFDLSNAFH